MPLTSDSTYGASIPFALGMRAWSRGRTFVVQLQDPRVNPREFDVVVPPIHDGLEGANVLPIVGALQAKDGRPYRYPLTIRLVS